MIYDNETVHIDEKISKHLSQQVFLLKRNQLVINGQICFDEKLLQLFILTVLSCQTHQIPNVIRFLELH